MPIALDAAGGTRLQTYLYAHIPLVQHMQVRVENWNAAGLTLSAPLAANINHENTAFGGSLENLAMLACWGLVWLLLENQPTAHIVVAEARTRFLHPVSGTLRAHCPMPDDASRDAFLEALRHHNKARVELQSRIVENDRAYVIFEGRFAAYRGARHAG